MTVTVYVDQFFLTNFMMDLLLLILVRKLTGIRSSPARLALGAFAGAGTAAAGLAAAFLFGPLWAWRAVSFFAGSAAMAKAAFGSLGGRQMGKMIAALCIAALLMAGCLYGLSSLPVFWLAAAFLQEADTGLSGGLAAAGLLLMACGAFFAVRAGVCFLAENRMRRQKFYNVCLRYRGKECWVRALWDTGNQLYEPAARLPVHILDQKAALALVKTVPGIFYIPYQSIGRTGGMLPAVYLDELEAEKDGCVFCIQRPIVALSARPVSPGGEYQMLLHASFPGAWEDGAAHHKEEKK